MDDIQRKLALFGKQLAGGRNLHKQIVSTSPLAFIAVGLIAGILIQNTLGLSVSIWLIILVLLTAATVFFFIVQQPSSNYQLPITNYQYATAYMACLCFVCLGAIRLTSFYQPKPDDICNLVGSKTELTTDYTDYADEIKNKKLKSVQSVKSVAKKINEPKLATIRGLIVTDPYINKNRGWKFAKFTFTDPASSFYLKVMQVKTIYGWAKTTGIVRVQVAEPVLDLKAGDYIQAYCWLDRFKATTNPGQFNTAEYLARKNVFIAASVKSRDGIKLLQSHPKGIFTKIKAKLREVATQALVGELPLEEPSRGLLQALLLGYRGNIDSRTYEAFRKTGLLHFISLSGLHVGILVWIIWQLCRTMGLMRCTQAIVCITAIGILLLIVPPRAPILRAAIICFVFCLSLFFRRYSNPLNTLSLAAIILLLMRPTCLFEAGWQLSFAVVLGLLLSCHRIHFFLYKKITGLAWHKEALKTKPFFRINPSPGPDLLTLFSTCLTAWLCGAGILLYHFYTINLLTSIWTVIAFPFVAGILIIGFLKIILSFLLPTVALGLGIIVTGLADLLIWIVQGIASWHIASWNISQILIGHVSLAPIILYYCFILFAAFVYFRRPLLKRAICAVMTLSLITFLGVTKWQRTSRDNLVLTCLDVGHGQAILAQLPGKANVLFDAGSLHESDIGRRIVAPFLDYSGISKIDAIIISHNDVDHINGILEIAEHCEVTGVYANDAFLSAA
ncbi:MAG: ComEC/Rec2 family competence protein, partial [Sedimentisphaerales bacterium]